MDDKLLTVVIANYNNEQYIAECLESIIGQTYRLLDIIIVDDGSNDDSLKIIKDYQKHDERIRVIRKEREGAASARALGMHYAKGTYITFPDSDDWLDLSMYSIMMEKALDENVDVVCNNSIIRVDHGNQEVVGSVFKEQSYIRENLNALRKDMFLIAPSLCCKIFKVSCIEKYIIAVDYNTKVSNDMAASYPALMNAKSIYMMNMPMYHYRVNHKQPSNLGPAIKINSYALTYCKLWNAFECDEDLLIKLNERIGKNVNQLLKGVLSYKELKKIRNFEAVNLMFGRYGGKKGMYSIRLELFRDCKYVKLMFLNRILPYFEEN